MEKNGTTIIYDPDSVFGPYYVTIDIYAESYGEVVGEGFETRDAAKYWSEIIYGKVD